MADPKIEALRRVPLFSGLDRRGLEEIGRLADEVELEPGRTFIRQGETGHEFFVVLEGSVRIERDGVQVETLGPGGYLGEIALIDERPRAATAVSEGRSRLLVIGHRDFHSLMERFPGVALQILRTLAARVRKTEPEAR